MRFVKEYLGRWVKVNDLMWKDMDTGRIVIGNADRFTRCELPDGTTYYRIVWGPIGQDSFMRHNRTLANTLSEANGIAPP